MKRVKPLLNSVIAATLSAVAFSVVAEEDRSAVLERIKPVGSVAVKGAAKPAEAKAPATPAAAPAAEAPQAAPAATEEKKAESAPAPAGGGDALALATSKGCMACHQVAIKVVGPAYKEVAAKYKGQADAQAKLLAKVKSGGSGTWGAIPMPPQAAVSDADLDTIIKWIMAM